MIVQLIYYWFVVCYWFIGFRDIILYANGLWNIIIINYNPHSEPALNKLLSKTISVSENNMPQTKQQVTGVLIFPSTMLQKVYSRQRSGIAFLHPALIGQKLNPRCNRWKKYWVLMLLVWDHPRKYHARKNKPKILGTITSYYKCYLYLREILFVKQSL